METSQLQQDHATSQDEFIAVDDVEKQVHKARRTFERTKNIAEQ